MTTKTVLETLEAARALSRRAIHTAYQWNDHNHAPAHMLAKETCKRVGLKTIEECEEFLDNLDAAIAKEKEAQHA